jgi:hypothetical protein
MDKIMTHGVPRGLMLACHVLVIFATRAARHVTCQHGRSHVACPRVLAMSLANITCQRGRRHVDFVTRHRTKYASVIKVFLSQIKSIL